MSTRGPGPASQDLGNCQKTQVNTVLVGIFQNQSEQQDDRGGFAPYGRLMPDLAVIVASNVRAERARRGWRQKDLADRMEWSIGMVSDTESGKRRIGIADMPRLCRGLEVPLRELLRGASPQDLAALDL